MPHLVILYTANLEPETNMTALCRSLADTMLALRDDNDQPVYPTGGTRVLAYPAPHYAVADGKADYAFVYLNLRMGRGRSEATKKRAGDALLMTTKVHFQPIFMQRHIGITLQIDEGMEVFDGKHSNLHPLFNTLPPAL
ncbi:MAG: 5-carboxymethyl-2-hydroxymuconate Delta-isomerase [Burkholderiaceae bacterium]|nr:5-carboxymethyl-2-hydroxymuconate Delta-isomerase [Burkholderiaceae bacterium]